MGERGKCGWECSGAETFLRTLGLGQLCSAWVWGVEEVLLSEDVALLADRCSAGASGRLGQGHHRAEDVCFVILSSLRVPTAGGWSWRQGVFHGVKLG